MPLPNFVQWPSLPNEWSRPGQIGMITGGGAWSLDAVLARKIGKARP